MDVSIIIVTYNTRQMTSECIDSVIAKTSGIEYEIILVDNASSDGSKDFFSNDSRVKYIYNEENLGFGRANNKGIEIAEGRNILFLNSDTLLRNNAIKILSDYLDNNPKVGACGGNLFDQYGKPTHSFYRRLPSILDDINCFLGNKLYKCLYGCNWEFNYTGKSLKVGHITGADLMVRKNVLDVVGEFDERFFMYYEDTELCFRIRKSGRTLISVPDAEITHYRKEHKEYSFYVMVEKHRVMYFRLTHTKSYRCFMYALRDFMSFLKCHSPKKKTRERWKQKK